MTPNEFRISQQTLDTLVRIAKALEEIADKTPSVRRGRTGPG